MEILTVLSILRQKLSDEGADSLIELLNRSNKQLKEDMLVFVEDKFEKRLTEEISRVNEKISNVSEKITISNSNMIKWMFIFWIGQIGAILGILLAFFK